MSTTTEPITGATAQPAAPRAPVRQPVVRRRRPAFTALGVALIAISAATGGWVYVATGHREPVVAIARDVPVGAELTADDLVEARISTDPALKPVSADDLKKMIGKRAAVALTKGSLLTKAQVTDEPLVKDGQQMVGVSLAASQIPATGLNPGQSVEVVHTSKDSTSTDSDKSGDPKSLQATVVEVGKPTDNSGDRVVDLAVSSLDGTTLARWTAADEVTLVVDPDTSGN